MTAPNTPTQPSVATSLSRWNIDTTHSDVAFAVKHMMISTVRGRFDDVSGYIEFDHENLVGGKIEVDINLASIDTGQEQRDNHLRSADFFDVESYPIMTFVSRKIEQVRKEKYQITGDLTIRGITHEVVLDGTFEGIHRDNWGGTRAAFSGTTVINRHDYELNWNQTLEAGGVLVGEAVRISLDIQAVKQA